MRHLSFPARRLPRHRPLAYVILSLASLFATAIILDHLFPLDLHRAREQSVLVVDAQDRLLYGFTTADGSWRLPLGVDAVDPLYLNMLKAYEDQRFDWHPGVDPLAVTRALWQWATHGRVVSGASTLTMQVARLLELRPRTLTSKLLETLRALQLEWHYDKDEILSLYLRLAPYGGNLEGLRAASLAWLGKEPQRLTPAEAAFLVVLPQAPSRLRLDRFPERARTARDKVLGRMAELGVLSPQQELEARQETLPQQRQSMPFHAPHLARYLRATQAERVLHRTFIDSGLQQTLETLAAQQPLEPQSSLAILVVENQERRVIAYVGSADFFATQRAGQVDMIRSVRSPGSTLKPLVYGMGFEDLIIHPETLIEDIPTRFGDYSPTNFHNTYQGQISIREALQNSLNVPAVAVLEQVGPARFAARLREAGIVLHWPGAPLNPGLPLVLGGVGTTLADLVTLYAGIASDGQVAPLRFSPADKTKLQQRLLSPAASWYLSRILEAAPPPQPMVTAAHIRQPRPIAYKTGTSYGFRDAWALGYDRAYTVGVWVGRPDGSPSPGHYGGNSAAPLLFRVFDLLPQLAMPATTIPEGVILADHAILPERLKQFRTQRVSTQTGVATLSISFPVPGSTVELSIKAGRLGDLPLVAHGGRRPLRWLVNSLPVPSSPWRHGTFWTPDGEGFVRIAVIDATGQTANAEVRVKKGAEVGLDNRR
jgi:penicillin-binding protein 1C